MKWRDAAGMAWQNLRQSRLRMALTILGVVVGIASLVCMFAFGLGMQHMATEQLTRNTMGNTISVFPMFRFEEDGDGGEEPPQTRIPLDDQALEKIRSFPGVARVSPVIHFPLRVDTAKGPQQLFGRTFAQGEATPGRLEFAAGSLGIPGTENRVVIGQWMLKKLGLPPLPAQAIGKELKLRFISPTRIAASFLGDGSLGQVEETVPFTVVGVLKKDDSFIQNSLQRTEIMIPLEQAKRLGLHLILSLGGSGRSQRGNFYTMAEVTVTDPNLLPAIEEKIGKLGLRAVSLQSILKEMNVFFLIFNSVLGAIGSIALIVAGLGIVNTMIIAVLEKRKDIGIMKSVGASRGAIRKQFFTEAAIVGFSGGLLGELLGWSVSKGVDAVVIHFIRQQAHGPVPDSFFHFPLWLLVCCLGFAVAVALVSALYPAARAAKLNPVDALRYE